MIDIEDKIIKARATLLNDYPYFGYPVLEVEIREYNKIPTMAVDALGNMYYNKDFVDSLSSKELRGVITHEILHLLHEHTKRINGRNPEIWNIACDAEVNPEVAEMKKMELPKGAVFIKDAEKYCTERLYELLMKKSTRVRGTSFDIMIPGTIDKNGNVKRASSKEIRKAIKKIKKLFVEGATYKKLHGQLPAGIERLLGKLEKPIVPFRELLRDFLSDNDIVDVDWSRRNRREYGEFIWPGNKRESLDAAFAIDTSGSMSEEELTRAVSELAGVLQSFDNVRLRLLLNDADIWTDNVIEDINDLYKIKIKGGGGTDFRPVFNKVKNTSVLVFITDGLGDYPNIPPSYPVIWILVGKDHIRKEEIPFGYTYDILEEGN